MSDPAGPSGLGAPPLAHAWLGRVEYRAAWDLQERLRRAILDGAPAETVLTLEHPHTITLGRAADPRHVLLDEARLAQLGVARVATSRGGDVTYHGPGQLVAYPIVRIGRGVVAHVEAMADAVTDVVRPLGIEAAFRRDTPGVWVGDRKLCAFGVHVHRRVAIHGLALNVTTALDAFSWIVPCGLTNARVTSIAELAPARCPTVEALAAPLGEAIAARLGRTARLLAPAEARDLLGDNFASAAHPSLLS